MQQPPFNGKMVQVQGYLLQNLLRLSSDWKEKDTPEGARGRWKNNFQLGGPLPLYHQVLHYSLRVKSASFGQFRSAKEVLGERPCPGHEGNERRHDQGSNLGGGH